MKNLRGFINYQNNNEDLSLESRMPSLLLILFQLLSNTLEMLWETQLLYRMSKVETIKEHLTLPKIHFYTTFLLAVIVLCSFSVLLFLIPFIVDPTLASIMSDFSETPVSCNIVHSKYILGENQLSQILIKQDDDIWRCK